jgi:hypothetical protein
MDGKPTHEGEENEKMRIHKRFFPAFLLLPMVLLWGCGGGGSSTSSAGSPNNLSGVAAAGAPIIGTATVKDSSVPPVTRAVPIAADGKYSIDVSDLKAPYMLRADGEVGGRQYSLFSAATEADKGGTINITPLTDLIVANIAGDIASNYYNSGQFSDLTREALDTQIATVTAQLMPVLTELGLDNSINLLRTSFNTDHSGMDAVMDVLKVSVDAETMIATITNVINNSTVTQDLTTSEFSGTIDGTGVATGVVTVRTIDEGFQALSSLFTNGLPSKAQIIALGLFDSTGFLQDGLNLDMFLDEITTNAPVGLTFANITVENTYTDNSVNYMRIAFTVMANGSVNGRERWLFREDPVTHAIQGLGNQRHVKVNLETQAEYRIGTPTGDTIATGIVLDIKDPGLFLSGNGVAVITGPGGVNQVYVNDISRDYFVIPGNNGSPLLTLTDGQIVQIPDINAEYTIALYDNTAGLMTLMENYTETIRKRPYLNSDLTVASFPAVTGTTPASHAGFTGGTISATWTLPAGLVPRWCDFWMGDNTGNNAHAEKDNLKATDSSASVTFTPLVGWTPAYAGVNVNAQDSFGRNLQTSQPF